MTTSTPPPLDSIEARDLELSALPEVLEARDVARVLRVHLDRVYGLIGEGRLPAHNLGTGARPLWRISREAFRAWLNAPPANESATPSGRTFAPWEAESAGGTARSPALGDKPFTSTSETPTGPKRTGSRARASQKEPSLREAWGIKKRRSR